MKKIAIVAYHFFKTKTRGGEVHVEKLINLLKNRHKITLITTQSSDHLTWKNNLPEKEIIDKNILILRFPVDFQVKPRNIVELTHKILKNKNKTIDDEINFIKSAGPYSTLLFQYLKKNNNNFDIFIFIGYANPITFFGLPIVKNKAILIPLTHKEPRLYFKAYEKLFNLPKIICPSSIPEKKLIKKRFLNHSPLKILGIYPGKIKENNLDFSILKEKYKIYNRYTIFIGRLEPYKGINHLIDYFKKVVIYHNPKIDLLIIGEKLFPIEKNNHIKYLGIVDEKEKQALIKNSLFLVNPSWYESLSLTVLEAWQQKKPVLVYGLNEILKKQVELAKGGLDYKNYQEFEKNMIKLIKNNCLRKKLGENGYSFYYKNYRKEVIQKKLERIINDFF